MNTDATLVVVKGWDKGKKCTYFISLSTTKKTTSYPMDLGRPSTKSILMSTQGLTGMGSGSNNPTGFDVSTLIL